MIFNKGKTTYKYIKQDEKRPTVSVCLALTPKFPQCVKTLTTETFIYDLDLNEYEDITNDKSKWIIRSKHVSVKELYALLGKDKFEKRMSHRHDQRHPIRIGYGSNNNHIGYINAHIIKNGEEINYIVPPNDYKKIESEVLELFPNFNNWKETKQI